MPFDGVPIIIQELLDARAQVEQGWCQGAFYIDAVSHPLVCLLGSLGVRTFSAHAPRAALELCITLYPNKHHYTIDEPLRLLAPWNDRECHTKEDVLGLIDRTVDRLMGEYK